MPHKEFRPGLSGSCRPDALVDARISQPGPNAAKAKSKQDKEYRVKKMKRVYITSPALILVFCFLVAVTAGPRNLPAAQETKTQAEPITPPDFTLLKELARHSKGEKPGTSGSFHTFVSLYNKFYHRTELMTPQVVVHARAAHGGHLAFEQFAVLSIEREEP